MKANNVAEFDLQHTLHELKHYLPAQAPLKDFVHHNTLHAFQHDSFFQGLWKASSIFGYKVTLNISDYRARFAKGEIDDKVLEATIKRLKGDDVVKKWMERMLSKEYVEVGTAKVGMLRDRWKSRHHVDMDMLVHGLLFRLVCSYLDQGISLWDFPLSAESFLSAVRELERNAFTSIFRRKRARQLLLDEKVGLVELLEILVGKKAELYERYLFDQQFAHQGWSGLVASVEVQPSGLLDSKPISLHDLMVLECLLEIDALDSELGTGKWAPLGEGLKADIGQLFEDEPEIERNEVIHLWQEAFEWSFYDEVLSGIRQANAAESSETKPQKGKSSFQAFFCIDDRECSLRRNLEHSDPNCSTFGTPGFFGMEFFFQPEGGRFYTKLCPAPVTPKYLIKEIGAKSKRKKDLHLSKNSHSLARGWLITQTLGFWSAFRLVFSIARPSLGPAASNSFQHMDKIARLTIENNDPSHIQDGLQVGFTVEEMAQRVGNTLRSVGLVENFAQLVYVVGHGASSVNNPHYAAYDCGACCGRPGSVNARVFCFAANHAGVRKILANKGIVIPSDTNFVGGLHDTTRDDIEFYDVDALPEHHAQLHQTNEDHFASALDLNALERSRRLELVDSSMNLEKLHAKIRQRAVSLFEPRPELNHATNALCIVGPREMTNHLFLDRRAFLNSYEPALDPNGDYLFGILKAAAPVCGGINLEYYFSRVDNQKLGAGSKLPHNVMGLFGVANGADGDLRPGLPSQMIEVHDPVRLLIIVQQVPDVVLQVIQRNAETYEWFANQWVHLVAIDPGNKAFFRFNGEAFEPYTTLGGKVDEVDDITAQLHSNSGNMHVLQIH